MFGLQSRPTESVDQKRGLRFTLLSGETKQECQGTPKGERRGRIKDEGNRIKSGNRNRPSDLIEGLVSITEIKNVFLGKSIKLALKMDFSYRVRDAVGIHFRKIRKLKNSQDRPRGHGLRTEDGLGDEWEMVLEIRIRGQTRSYVNEVVRRDGTKRKRLDFESKGRVK